MGLAFYLKRVGFWIILLLITAIVILPIFWIVLTAFRPASEAFSASLPSKLTLYNFIKIFKNEDFLLYTKNSLIVSLTSAFFALLIGSLAGYSLARYQSWFSNASFAVIFILRSIPFITMAIPLSFFMRYFNLYNTLGGLAFVDMSIHICLVTWIMQGFFLQIPKELEEAALVDGCSGWSALFRVVAPLTLPGITAAGVLIFLYDWNEFLFANTFIGSMEKRVLTIAIANKAQEIGLQWNLMSAASVLAMVPAILLVFIAQRYLVKGLVAGAVKG